MSSVIPAGTHSAVSIVWHAMPEADRPPPPFHLGGPKPLVSFKAHARIALAIGEAVVALRAARDPELDLAVDAMRRAVVEQVPTELVAGESFLPSRSLASALRYAAHIAPSYRFKGEKGGLPLKALDDVVHGATREPGVDLRALLSAADDSLMREELAETLSARAPDAPRNIARVLWRVGPPDGANHWIAKLEDALHLLLYRTPRESGKRQSWICVCASRADVLAAVPDAWAQLAMRALG